MSLYSNLTTGYNIFHNIGNETLRPIVKGATIGALDELASADESAIGDETISDAQGSEDAVSHQGSNDGLYYVDRTLAKKQEDGRIYYLTLRSISGHMRCSTTIPSKKDYTPCSIYTSCCIFGFDLCRGIFAL